MTKTSGNISIPFTFDANSISFNLANITTHPGDSFSVSVGFDTSPPVIISDGGTDAAILDISENFTAVTTVQASDPDEGATIGYSIAGGDDAALFNINAETGTLSFVNAPNFEAPADADHDNVYDVTVQASDGSLSDTQALAVTVQNIVDKEELTGPVYPAPGGNDFSGSGNSGRDGGQTRVYSGFGSSVDNLYWGLDAVKAAMDGNADAANENLHLTSISSDGLTAIWSGYMTTSLGGTIETQLVATIDPTESGTARWVTDGSLGFTTGPEALIDVDETVGTFKVNVAFQADNGSGWDSFLDVYDAYSGEKSGSVLSSSGLFYGQVLNSAPTANADSVTVDEDSGSNALNSDVLGNDTDADSDPLVIVGASGAAHGTVTVQNGALSYAPDADYNGADTFAYTIDDGHGHTSMASVNVTVGAVNDPVQTAAPGNLDATADAQIAVTGLSISDADATLSPTGVYEVTLSATDATLSLTTLTGLTFTAGDGTGDDSMTFHGTLSDINTALATAQYTANAHYAGASEITLQASDGYGGAVASGTGEATGDTSIVSVTVSNIDEPATGTLTVTGVAKEGDTLTASLTDASDPDGAITNTAYQWQHFVANSSGGDLLNGVAGIWTDIAYATDADFNIPVDSSYDDASVRVVVTTTDAVGGTTAFQSDAQVVATAITAGDDTDNVLTGTDQVDRIDGNGGNDVIRGLDGSDLLNGGDGHDMLYGGSGDDALHGDSGDDYLRGDDGNDYLDGGAGIDRITYATAPSGVTVDLGISGPQDTGSAGTDTITGVENVSGSSYGDTIIGDDADNWLWGGAGAAGISQDDTIRAGGGNDLVEVGAGNNIVDGGSGIDTLSLLGNGLDISSAGVVFNLARQGSAQNSRQGMMTATNFENLSGSIYGDKLTGDGHANVLAGDSGDDTLIGGGGSDILYGDGEFSIDRHGISGGPSGPITLYPDVSSLGFAAGNDTLQGGRGADQLYGGGGIDTASYAIASGAVQVALGLDGAAGSATGADGNDTLYGIENISGSGFSDTLTGNELANVIAGGGGADVIDGGLGNDTLKGGAGNDRIIGGSGTDTFWGSIGADTFVFTSLADSSATAGDTILDFSGLKSGKSAGQGDKIDVSGIDANSGADGDQAFTLVSAFSGAAGQAYHSYDSAHHVTNIYFDVDGDQVADAVIHLTGNATLSAGDFIF